MLDREMAEKLGLSRSYVSQCCRALGLKRPKEVAHQRRMRMYTDKEINRRRKVALTNENIKKNQFREGHVSKRAQPIGAKFKDKRDGYWRIKVSDIPKLGRDNWKYMHRVVWEEHYGEIPPRHFIIFLDGNKDNISIDNLYMINNSVFAIMNRHYKFTGNPESTKTFIKVAELKLAICDTRRRKNNESRKAD